jgi:hypothetical protein
LGIFKIDFIILLDDLSSPDWCKAIAHKRIDQCSILRPSQCYRLLAQFIPSSISLLHHMLSDNFCIQITKHLLLGQYFGSGTNFRLESLTFSFVCLRFSFYFLLCYFILGPVEDELSESISHTFEFV